MRDYSKPHIIEEGFAFCFSCNTYTFNRHIQKVGVRRYLDMEIIVPEMVYVCMECLEEVSWYKRGDYDDMLALYQIHAELLKRKNRFSGPVNE